MSSGDPKNLAIPFMFHLMYGCEEVSTGKLIAVPNRN